MVYRIPLEDPNKMEYETKYFDFYVLMRFEYDGVDFFLNEALVSTGLTSFHMYRYNLIVGVIVNDMIFEIVKDDFDLFTFNEEEIVELVNLFVRGWKR